MVNEVHFNGERGSHKGIQEEIQEGIQEEMCAEERGAVSDISKGHSLSTPAKNNLFIEMSDEWQPKEEFLLEEEKRLKLDLFPIDKDSYHTVLKEFISYRRANDKNKRKDEEWSRLFVKSLVYHIGYV